MSKKKNCAQKMGHLGEFCAKLEATIVGVGAALPRARLIIIFGKCDFVRRLRNAKNKCIKYFYFNYEVILLIWCGYVCV